MKKQYAFLTLVLILLTSLFTGCSISSKATASGQYEIVRKATLGGKWQMYQIRIKLDSGGAYDLDLLNLANEDKVDGYFYPEKGSGASLQIKAGDNVIYQAVPTGVLAGGTLSDRFSFSASQPAGTAYVLNFTNGGTEKNISVFVELIYPVTCSIRGPIDVK